MLQMVGDIEHAMERDLDSLDWMSPETKVRAKQKLHAIANKIGYPDHWRDYTRLSVNPDEPCGNSERASAFENDRQLNKIGKPVDHTEWGMTPPTVNAYYNPSMNDINFPAGILQPNFYDPKADDAVNYGHIGAVIGHELTHGFDDEGKKFDDKGNLSRLVDPRGHQKVRRRKPTASLTSTASSSPSMTSTSTASSPLAKTPPTTAACSSPTWPTSIAPNRTTTTQPPRPTATPARSASTSPTPRTGARTTARKASAAAPRPTPTRPDTFRANGPHRQPARLRRSLLLQAGHAHGAGQELSRLVTTGRSRPCATVKA